MMNSGRSPNILLVDDEEMFLSSLSEGLRRRFPEMTFRTASDGEAALDSLGEHTADLVITDLKMPRMDGFQLLAAMHSRYPAVPLLIMTAHSTELSEGKAMSAGALHCIDKPVDLAELARRIDELFSTGAIATLRGVSLAAFLQLLGLERKSGIVDVRASTTRARLYLRGGQIIHAEDERESGLNAALRAVSLDDVEIHFRPGSVPKVPTIDLPLTQILLDAARMRDELERNGADNFDEAFGDSFSDSFSDAFDEQLLGLEVRDDAARSARRRSTRITRTSTSQIRTRAEVKTATMAALSATPQSPAAAAASTMPATVVPTPAAVRPTKAPPATAPAAVVPTPAAVRPTKPPPMSTALPVPPPARAGATTMPIGSRAGFTSLPARARPPTSPQAPMVKMPYSVEANVSDAVSSCLRKIGEINRRPRRRLHRLPQRRVARHHHPRSGVRYPHRRPRQHRVGSRQGRADPAPRPPGSHPGRRHHHAPPVPRALPQRAPSAPVRLRRARPRSRHPRARPLPHRRGDRRRQRWPGRRWW